METKKYGFTRGNLLIIYLTDKSTLTCIYTDDKSCLSLQQSKPHGTREKKKTTDRDCITSDCLHLFY